MTLSPPKTLLSMFMRVVATCVFSELNISIENDVKATYSSRPRHFRGKTHDKESRDAQRR